MALISGDTGSITIAADTNLDATLNKWTLDISIAMMEAVLFAQTYKTKARGVYEWSGTADGYVDSAGILTAGGITNFATAQGLDGTITLTMMSGETFSGSCSITSIKVTTDRNAFVGLSLGFAGQGALTITSA